MSTITGTSSHTLLPRLTPKSTSIVTPFSNVKSAQVCTPPKLVTETGAIKPKTLQNICIPSVHDVYPPKPITSIDVGDFHGLPSRVNPLRPSGVRRTAMLETTDRTWENQKRSQTMQRMTRLRYHTAYEKYPYGSPAEQEIYRRLFREGLKQQMTERDQQSRYEFQRKVSESREASLRDQDDLRRDAAKYYSHYCLMTTYRDANKELMEEQWNRRRHEISQNISEELEILRYNPINWSCSLK